MSPLRLDLVDRELWTGIPFVVQVKSSSDQPRPNEILVRPLDVEGAAPFTVVVKPVDSTLGVAELSLQLAGKYRAEVAGASVPLEIRPRQDLSFAAEFGVFSAVVIILLGGMLLWVKRHRQKLEQSA